MPGYVPYHPASCGGSYEAAYGFVFGIQIVGSERLVVGGAVMNRYVMRDDAGLTYAMTESDPAYSPDQFLAARGAAGVQHVAFRTGTIVAAARESTTRGARFVPLPGTGGVSPTRPNSAAGWPIWKTPRCCSTAIRTARCSRPSPPAHTNATHCATGWRNGEAAGRSAPTTSSRCFRPARPI